jgi:multiple sugar transport system ATP-binding protein
MGRAIVRKPAAFLMDEPLSNLDAKLRVQMRAEVSRLQDRLGTTTIYVTHDQTEAMTLGDRVAVMRSGVIQQVDRPQQLYDNPRNLFVAGFIGSPAMNFMAGEVEDGHVKLPMVDVPVPDALRGELQAGRKVIVGVRPEHMEDASLISERHRGVTFRTKIDLMESMGSELYAHFEVGGGIESEELRELAEDAGAGELPRAAGEGGRAIARLSPDSNIHVGRESELWLETDKLQFFDPDTGRSLAVRDQEPVAA